MAIGDHLTTAAALAHAGGDTGPLALIDLPTEPDAAFRGPLPPCPVIGIGDRGHPLAAGLDAIVEPPVTVAALVAAIEAQADAAAALVTLLRSIDGLSPQAALPLESTCLAMLQGSRAHARWLQDRRQPASQPPGSVMLDRRGPVLHITIDRPAARNAIDRTMRDALHAAFTVAAWDAAIERIVLRATGRAFGGGADLAEFGTTRDPATAHGIRMRTLPAWPLLACADRVDVVVQGACVGASLELAAFAARVVARRDAWFQLPELAMGIIPGAGGCVSVPRRIGRQRAALMMLSGRRIDAATALRWGLVDRIEDAAPGDDGHPHAI